MFLGVNADADIGATLIFIERDAFFDRRPNALSHGKDFRFWVDCSYEDQRHDNSDRTKNELIADILRDYERSGHAMRYLNVKGQIAWKASPACFRCSPTSSVRPKTIWRIGPDASGDGVENQLRDACWKVRTPDHVFVALLFCSIKTPRQRAGVLLQGSTEARSHSGANCLGRVSVQSRSQRDLRLPHRRVRPGDVVGGRRSGDQPASLCRFDLPTTDQPFAAIIRCTADPAKN